MTATVATERRRAVRTVPQGRHAGELSHAGCIPARSVTYQKTEKRV